MLILALVCVSLSLCIMSGVMVGMFVGRLQDEGVQRLLMVQESGAQLAKGAREGLPRGRRGAGTRYGKQGREGLPRGRRGAGTRLVVEADEVAGAA